MTEAISLDDRGLDLVLGGGLRRVRRTQDTSGTVVVVRGPAGSGKTLVGFHTALALAKKYPGSIAYACIELLPTELEAQIRSQRGDRSDVVILYPGATAMLTSVPDNAIVVEARVLGLGESVDALGAGVKHLWESLSAAGRKPGVVVIDSLIDGYGIGSSASREFADAVCKLAAHWGIALVLLEECSPGVQSPWIYAADTVLELGVVADDVDASRPAPFERRLTVLKHRYGPSDAGPHRFLLEPGIPVQVLPRPSAWLEPWTTSLEAGVPAVGHQAGSIGVRRFTVDISKVSPSFSNVFVVAAFGSIPARLFEEVRHVRDPDSTRGDLVVNLTLPLGERRLVEEDQHRKEGRSVGIGHPFLSAHRLLRLLLDEVQRGPTVGRVVVSDLRALRSFSNADGLRRALAVFCVLMRRLRIPVVLVESTTTAVGATALSVDFADVSIEVREDPAAFGSQQVVRTDLRNGTTVR